MIDAFEPGVANQPDVRMPSDAAPAQPLVIRRATEEERAQYGIRRPLREVTRSGEAKATVVHDIDALAAAAEHLREDGRFNLTVILEEAAG